MKFEYIDAIHTLLYKHQEYLDLMDAGEEQIEKWCDLRDNCGFDSEDVETDINMKRVQIRNWSRQAKDILSAIETLRGTE